MMFNIAPAPETEQLQLDPVSTWQGSIYSAGAIASKIIDASTDRKKLFLENRSLDNIYIQFGDVSSEPMAIFPDSAWVEESAAHLSVWIKGNGNLYVAEWI